MTSQSYTEPVAKLLTLGRPVGEWPDYPTRFGLTSADIPELLRMAQDDDLRFMEHPEDASDDDELPEWYAGVYAWRALAQLKAHEAVPVMLHILRKSELDDEYDEDDWLASEAHTLFCLIGPTVIPDLAAALTDRANPPYMRGSLGEAFGKIAETYPEIRDACVAPILEALRDHAHNDEMLNGFLISSLVEMGVGVEHIALIEEVFATDNVDVWINGDLEDTKIQLGLLDERITPPPKSPFSFFPNDMLPSTRPSAKAKSAPKKEKNKRKQEKKSRKKNRKK